MTLPVSFQTIKLAQPDPILRTNSKSVQSSMQTSDSSDIGQKFEQMLWTEMLTYAGLDKAFSQGSGEAASAFSRYIVEAISADLSKTHPMGLSEAVNRSIAAQQPKTDEASA